MTNESPVEDRDALYYPFIHIRDEAWLRSTLLFFPRVVRMTPGNYALQDSEFVRELANTEGRRGPLVDSYRLDSYPSYEAGLRLATRFEADVADPSFCAKYDRSETLRGHGDDSLFQIHRDKFAFPLINVLSTAGLAWSPSRPNRGDWFAVHPVIGEVMMSTVAAAAARSQGLDVLTDAGRNHVITSSRDEQAIYDALLGRSESHRAERKPTEAEVGHLVVATTFDLAALKATDFAALAEERAALFDLRGLLAKRAGEIPAMSDRATRDKRAREAAERIVDEWEKKRKKWKGFINKFFRLEAAAEAKGAATELLKLAIPAAGAGAAGGVLATGGMAAAGSSLLLAVPGLAVGVVYYGFKTWNEVNADSKASPTRFLSVLADRGGVLTAASAPSLQSRA
jgi:hypothetical protein